MRLNIDENYIWREAMIEESKWIKRILKEKTSEVKKFKRKDINSSIFDVIILGILIFNYIVGNISIFANIFYKNNPSLIIGILIDVLVFFLCLETLINSLKRLFITRPHIKYLKVLKNNEFKVCDVKLNFNRNIDDGWFSATIKERPCILTNTVGDELYYSLTSEEGELVDNENFQFLFEKKYKNEIYYNGLLVNLNLEESEDLTFKVHRQKYTRSFLNIYADYPKYFVVSNPIKK